MKATRGKCYDIMGFCVWIYTNKHLPVRIALGEIGDTVIYDITKKVE